MTESYATANKTSFYPHELVMVQAAIKAMEEVDKIIGDGSSVGGYVQSAEVVLASNYEVFATIWWDAESESYRAQITRPERPGEVAAPDAL